MAATSNVLSPSDIQGYLSRLKNTTPDPMTLLKQGGVAQQVIPQKTQVSQTPVNQNPVNPVAANNYSHGNILGAGGAISSLPGINASNMTLGQNPVQNPVQTPVRQVAQASVPVQQPVQPVAQSSYQGGQALPAVGTPEYAQAQALANKPAQVTPPTVTPTQNPSQSTQPPQIPGAFSTFLGGLGAMGFGGSPQVNKAAQDLATFRQQYANTLADVQGDPNLSMDTKTGIGQILSNRAATQESALSGLLSSALSGQGQQITALQGGASATAPVTQFGVLTSPVTGQPISPGTTPGSAAFQGGFIGGQQQAGVSAAQMNVANTAAKGIQGTIQQYLQSNSDLNASPLAIGNAAQQWLQGKQLADPRYQTLFNYLNEYTNTLAPILGVGGDPTNLKTQIAQGFINAQASGQSISQVLNDIGNLADQKLQNIISAGQGGGQVAGATPQGGTPTSFGSEW